MKPTPQDIIGKRPETVLIRESEDGRPPQAQLFLCFDDGTSVEFWADGDIHRRWRPGQGHRRGH